MNWNTRLCRIGLGLCAALSSAHAQTATRPPGETVTVNGLRPRVQVLPDRTVYSLDKNILSSVGTLSDVLRNLPSVDVDIQGNVSIRGESSVTILIDGQKSPLLAGNRADALQQIPAEMVDRIEIITNPSAEFRADGSGGIINIILRKDKSLVASGLVRVNVGDKGRANVSVSGKSKLGPVFLNGGYSERRDGQNGTSSTTRTDGINLRSSQQAQFKSVYAGRTAFLYASLNPNGRNEVDAGGSYNRTGRRYTTLENNVSVLDATDLTRDGLLRIVGETLGGNLRYRRKFATKDEDLNVNLSHYAAWVRIFSDYTTLDAGTGVANYWQSRQSKNREAHTEFKTDYVLPLSKDSKFKIGYELHDDVTQTDNHGYYRNAAAADWIADNTYTYLFALDRITNAGYVSYEQHFGPFGVIGGLRFEQDLLNTNLKTTGEVHDTSTLGFYPNLHLSYKLTDTQQVRLSYSRRMNRPQPGQLNPARFSSDAFNVRAGNPLLKPEQADSFEASYRYTHDKFDAVLTGYYRATYKGITSVYRYLSNSVLLTTTDNLARRMASGVEANVTADLLEGLSLRTSGTLAYNEFNPGATGVGLKRSGMSWNVKGGLDWEPTPDDLIQFNTTYSGKQRFPQGYREPTLSGDLGYKHKFGGGLSGILSINNLYNSWTNKLVLDSPGLHQVSGFSIRGRVFYIGLVYSFGNAKDTERPVGENENGAAASPIPGYPGGP